MFEIEIYNAEEVIDKMLPFGEVVSEPRHLRVILCITQGVAELVYERSNVMGDFEIIEPFEFNMDDIELPNLTICKLISLMCGGE